jgi:hypothetical protein
LKDTMLIENGQTSALEVKRFLNSIPDEQLEYCRMTIRIPRLNHTGSFIVSSITPQDYDGDKLVTLVLSSWEMQT